MHKSGAQHHGGAVTQADADRCCAAAPQTDRPVPSTTEVAPADSIASVPVAIELSSLTLASLFSPIVEADTGPPIGRSRHVFLSVFLI